MSYLDLLTLTYQDLHDRPLHRRGERLTPAPCDRSCRFWRGRLTWADRRVEILPDVHREALAVQLHLETTVCDFRIARLRLRGGDT